MTESVIVYFVAAIALFVNKSDTNRAAIFLYSLLYSAAILISLDSSANYFMLSILSTTLFIVSLSMLSRATKLVLLLCLTDIILTSIDLISLVAYNLNIEDLYKIRESATFYVGIAQLTCLLVTDVRSVNISTIRYNLSLFIHRASGLFVRRAEIHHTKRSG